MKSQLLSITLLLVIGQVIGGSIGGQFKKEQNPRPPKHNWGVSTIAQLQNPKPPKHNRGVSTIAQLENEEVPEDRDTCGVPCIDGACSSNCGSCGCGCNPGECCRPTAQCTAANSATNSTTPVKDVVENVEKMVMNVFNMFADAVKKWLADDASEDAVDATTPPDVRATAPPAPSTPASLYRLHAQNEKKKGGKKHPLAK